MGFGAAAPTMKGPSLGLLATLPGLSRELVAGALEAGAEALIVPAGLAADPQGLRSLTSAFPQCLWGLQLEGGQAPAPDLGFHFSLLSPSSALSVLRGEEEGHLLAIDPTWDDAQLRSLDPLGLDGVVFPLAPSAEEYVQIRHLLAVRRLALLLRKALVMELARPLSGEDLALLRDGGLSGLLVAGPAAQWVETIKELRQALESLPPRSQARRQVDVVLPFVLGGRTPQTEEEEEET